jgi:dihydroorotate dehydrogenase electron transfer subunit
LAGLKAGEVVQVLGPLGNGFTLTAFPGRTVLVAGGMGAAPLLFLAEAGLRGGALDRSRTEILYGAPTAGALCAAEAFRSLGVPVQTATDDGSAGVRGTVLDLLDAALDGQGEAFRIFAVGPEVMYRELEQRLAGRKIPCQVSVERRMGCGLGVCRSCVVPVRERGGSRAYRDVCRTGPVFALEELALETVEGND